MSKISFLFKGELGLGFGDLFFRSKRIIKIMKKLLLTILLLPTLCDAQKTYDVTGMLATNQLGQNITGIDKIAKVNIKIVISDSTFTEFVMGKEVSYKIIKKVDDNNFKISDGLVDYIIRISNDKFRKYSGMIVQDGDKGMVALYYK